MPLGLGIVAAARVLATLSKNALCSDALFGVRVAGTAKDMAFLKQVGFQGKARKEFRGVQGKARDMAVRPRGALRALERPLAILGSLGLLALLELA